MSKKSGFTLIELLIAVTIFVIVISIASGVFVQSLRTQRQVVGLMAANDNASLTLEQMVREIRTGVEFRINGQGDRLEFINARWEAVVYELQNGSVFKNNNPITADNVKVKYLLFNLMGEVPENGQSTRVTINMGVSATGKNIEGYINNLQTTVAARTLDS